MTLNVNIETKHVIKILTLVTLFTGGVFAVAKMYDALILVGTSFFFALALNPAVSFFSKYMPKQKRGPAVAIVMLLAISLISLIIVSIITPISREASAFADMVPARIEELRQSDGPIGQLISRANMNDEIENSINNLKNNAEQFAQIAFRRAGQVSNSIITTFTGFVMTILMLLNGPAFIKRFSEKIYRSKHLKARHEKIAEKMYGVVTGYVNGQVLVALVASLFSLGAMFLFKIPYPLPLASIVFVFGLIPLIGNTLAAVIVVLFAVVLKDLTSALLLAGFFVLYQQVENATLQPMVQGKTTQLPTLVIFISVILGVALMGPIGGLFAIPVAGCAKVLLNDYLEHRDDINANDSPIKFAEKLKNKLISKPTNNI